MMNWEKNVNLSELPPFRDITQLAMQHYKVINTHLKKILKI